MLNNWLIGETKYIEYKFSYTKTFLKTVCAYANYHDGWLIFGVDNQGKIVGVKDADSLRLSIEHGINDALLPVPYYEIEEVIHDEKSLLVLHVYKGEHAPYTCSGKAYCRKDTSTVQVDRYQMSDLILSGRNTGFDESDYRSNHLSFAYLQSKLMKDMGIRQLTEDILRTLELKKHNYYTNAAALFSDNNPLKSSVINLVCYSDETVKEIVDREVVEGVSLLEQYEACIRFFKKHLNTAEKIEGPYRQTVEEVPLVAYREAVTNAIVHRDYNRQVAIRIEIFSDRIEIVSPGNLPVGLSEEEYQSGRLSLTRNRIVADVFKRLGIIEKFGTGIKRIKEYYSKSKLNPSFLISENSVLVILPRNNTQSPKAKESQEAYSDLEDREQIVYQLLKAHGPLARKDLETTLRIGRSQTGEVLKTLKAKGIIVMVGNGRNSKYKLLKP